MIGTSNVTECESALCQFSSIDKKKPSQVVKYPRGTYRAFSRGVLGRLIQRDFPNLAARCELKQGDANGVLCVWCKERNWNKERAVVFLNPYGMQVEWSTIQALGTTKAVDLWYLFPLGVARMLTRDGKIEDSWRKRLTTLFGTADWEERFYRMEARKDLFG